MAGLDFFANSVTTLVIDSDEVQSVVANMNTNYQFEHELDLNDLFKGLIVPEVLINPTSNLEMDSMEVYHGSSIEEFHIALTNYLQNSVPSFVNIKCSPLVSDIESHLGPYDELKHQITFAIRALFAEELKQSDADDKLRSHYIDVKKVAEFVDLKKNDFFTEDQVGEILKSVKVRGDRTTPLVFRTTVDSGLTYFVNSGGVPIYPKTDESGDFYEDSFLLKKDATGNDTDTRWHHSDLDPEPAVNQTGGRLDLDHGDGFQIRIELKKNEIPGVSYLVLFTLRHKSSQEEEVVQAPPTLEQANLELQLARQRKEDTQASILLSEAERESIAAGFGDTSDIDAQIEKLYGFVDLVDIDILRWEAYIAVLDTTGTEESYNTAKAAYESALATFESSYP